MSGQREMPIFTKTYDFLAWLVPADQSLSPHPPPDGDAAAVGCGSGFPGDAAGGE